MYGGGVEHFLTFLPDQMDMRIGQKRVLHALAIILSFRS